jgi:hypothetical protein
VGNFSDRDWGFSVIANTKAGLPQLRQMHELILRPGIAYRIQEAWQMHTRGQQSEDQGDQQRTGPEQSINF